MNLIVVVLARLNKNQVQPTVTHYRIPKRLETTGDLDIATTKMERKQDDETADGHELQKCVSACIHV